MRAAFRNCLAVLVIAGWVAGCGARGMVSELDRDTGVTFVHGHEPFAFARAEPRYSRSGRDYLFLGPVETNRQGIREYYLWVGVGTTLDRGFLAPLGEIPKTLYLDMAGEPIELPLHPWQESVAWSSRRSVYTTAVPIRVELAARVTLQQLTLLNQAPLDSLRVLFDVDGASRTFTRWGEDGSFADFLREVAPGGG